MAVMAMLTRADLDTLPEDGLRHELIDGSFVLTPAPGVEHQRVVGGLFAILRSALQAQRSTIPPGDRHELEVLLAPLDVVLGANVVQPDLVLAPRSAFTKRDLPTAPVLVVEVRSASTGWLDEGRKRTLYAEAGVAHYWLVDPETPCMTALRLVDGRYEEVAHATGEETIALDSPVSLSLCPAHLAHG